MPLRPSIHERHPQRRRLARWAKRAALALGTLATAAALVRAWLPKPVTVDVAIARRTALVVEIDEDGKTRVRDRFVVSAPISGNLERIELEPGSPIAAGDIVARIAPPDPALLDPRSREEAQARLGAALARQRGAQTAITRATAAREAAVRDADRARTLAGRGAIPTTERERAELAEQLANGDLTAAQAERAGAAADVAAARAVLGQGDRHDGHRDVAIAAPSTGQVLRVIRDSAGPVVAGAPLLEVGDPHAIEAVVDVLSSDAPRIAPGMAVEIEGWGGDRALHGRVRRVEPSAFTRISALGVEEQRVNVVAAIDAPPPTLGDGFRIDARIITWRGERVLAVPASTVFRDRDHWAVYAVEDGRARLRPVGLGHHGRLDVEIASGLADGAQVIVHPGDRIADGARIAARVEQP
jgi:HlyD family secretion protein